MTDTRTSPDASNPSGFSLRVRSQRSTAWLVQLIVLVAVTASVVLGCSTQEYPGLAEYNLGVELQQSGKTELAEQKFRLALQKNELFAEAHLNLGLIYLNRGWYEGAEESTLRAKSLFERQRSTLVEGYQVHEMISLCYNNLGALEVGRALGFMSESHETMAWAHHSQAMSYFHQAVYMDSSNSIAQGNIQRYSSLILPPE